jgi:carbonic anhydrase
MPSLCQSGKYQSPISIKSNQALSCKGNCELFFYYRSSTCTILNNSNELILDYDTGSYIIYNSIVYELDKISFSIPSSHRIDSSDYPMEVFLYHKSMDFGKILIISVFLDVNDSSSISKHFLDMLINNLPQNSGEEKTFNTPRDWNIFNIVPESKAFYTYNGSLPHTPCTEKVTWIIMDTPVNISNSVYSNIKSVIGKNSRRIQKKYSRKIYFNSNISDKCNRNYGSKLKCYTDEEIKQKCSCMCKKGETIAYFPNIGSALLFIILCIVLIVVCLVLCIQFGLFDFTLKKFKNFIQYQPDILKLSS